MDGNHEVVKSDFSKWFQDVSHWREEHDKAPRAGPCVCSGERSNSPKNQNSDDAGINWDDEWNELSNYLEQLRQWMEGKVLNSRLSSLIGSHTYQLSRILRDSHSKHPIQCHAFLKFHV